jgi:hypothetical protein
MAAVLTTQVFPHNGAAVTLTTTASGGLAQTGNTTPCGQDLALLIQNATAGTITLNMTVPSGITVDGMPVTTPFAVTVAIGTAIVPLPAVRYADPTTGLATFGFAATPTSVSVACISTSS